MPPTSRHPFTAARMLRHDTPTASIMLSAITKGWNIHTNHRGTHMRPSLRQRAAQLNLPAGVGQVAASKVNSAPQKLRVFGRFEIKPVSGASSVRPTSSV